MYALIDCLHHHNELCKYELMNIKVHHKCPIITCTVITMHCQQLSLCNRRAASSCQVLSNQAEQPHLISPTTVSHHTLIIQHHIPHAVITYGEGGPQRDPNYQAQIRDGIPRTWSAPALGIAAASSLAFGQI